MATDGLAIIGRICEALVAATPHIRLAWAWVGSPDATVIRPVISAGPAIEYANSLVLKRDALEGRGPAFRALCHSQEYLTEVSPDSTFEPWRHAAAQHHFRVAVVMPLSLPDPAERGLLVFYADQPDYFTRVGMQPFRAIARLSEAALSQAALRRQLERQAATDALTGVLNRRAMSEALERQLTLARRHQKIFSVVMFDIDHFKAVNDRYGHAVGDDVIRHMARVASAQLRNEDQLARWGGEEFLCLLPEADSDSAELVAEKLRVAVSHYFSSASSSVETLTASFGVATYDSFTLTIDHLLLRADKSMYVAKELGRDRVIAG